jgi:hypothetical protein
MAQQAYCMKCKTKREMSGGKSITMKNGRKAMKGKCKKCGTKVFAITGGATSTKMRRSNKRKSRKNRTKKSRK